MRQAPTGVARYTRHIGLGVRIRVSGYDEGIIIVGRFEGIAERVNDNAASRPTYDAVISQPSGHMYTISLSRIIEITEEPK